ncbi:MAG: hypothetical protein Q4F24_04150 [Eubacteriales bacterium]|nr:hypothetical protein [Eubacteriales bacterium]
MYKVSQKYLEAMKRPVQRHRIKGTVGDVPFTEANILSGSFSITGQCSDASNVQIGQVYITELKITLIKNLHLSRYSLKGTKLTPYFGLRVDAGEYEYIPLGVFTISSASWSASGVEITAYDNMADLDRSFTASTLIGTPFQLCKLACESCGLSLGMSAVDFTAFANGTTKLQLYTDNDIETWRDVLSWVAQTIGCNVFADRDGSIVLRAYGKQIVDTIDTVHRFTGCTFDDYETRYTGISVVNVEKQMTNYYGDQEQGDGLTYNLGTNPFLQTASEGTVKSMVLNILDALGQIQYVPFHVSMIGNPAYDLMDVFRFEDGLADGDKISCMTKYTWTYNAKYAIQGVGQNPALVSSKSKSDKNISGLMEQVKSITSSINKLIYDFNTGPIVVKQREQTLGMITYYISEDADVEGHFLMNYTASESTHLTIRFYDQAVEELYSPVEIDIVEGEGQISIPHAYLTRSVGVHGVYVTAQCLSGEIYIDTRGVFFTIDAGNFAEAVDDISMDVRDITMRQLLESNGPDQIWIVGLEDGKMLVSKRAYSESYNSNPEWEGVYTPGKAKDVAIEFDGTWVLRDKDEKFTIETEDQPWFFWVDEEDKLIAQRGEDEDTRLELDTEVSQVSACRGYSSNLYPEQDQGLVVLYVKGEKPYYRQYVYDVGLKAKRWLDAEILMDEKVEFARVHRLNDYRLGFELTTESRNLWMYTARTYVAQAVPRECVRTSIQENLAFLYCPADTDLSVVMEPIVSEDMLLIQLNVNRELVCFDSSMRDVVTFNEDSISSSDVEKISFENHDGGSTIVIKLKNRPKKLITYIYVNKAKVNDLLCKIGSYGTIICPFMTATIDTTVYRYMDISETIVMGSKDSNIRYTPVGENTYRPKAEVVSVEVQKTNLRYIPVGYQNYDAATEVVSFEMTSPGIVYQQTGTSPI